MPDEMLRRRVHLLVRGPTPGTFLATDRRTLPAFAVEVDPNGDDTTLTLSLRIAAEQFGLDGVAVLDALIDDDAAADEDGALPAVVVLDSPSTAWQPPAGHTWQHPPLVGPQATLTRARCTAWVDELSSGEALPAGRAAWCLPGWRGEAEAWIFERLAAAGRAQTGRFEPYRWCAISAVGRVPTSSGRVWFKSVFPHFWQEPALTQAIADLAPESIPNAIAVDHERGWMLLDDVGSVTARDTAEADDAIIDRLIALQRASIGRTDDLVACGAPHRPLAEVPRDLDAALRDPIAQHSVAVSDARTDALVHWLHDVAASTAALGFPETLVHGDFHQGNVAVVNAAPVIFDWSDAAVAHPLLDFVTWIGWSSDTERIERSWQAFLSGWADVCPPSAIDAMRPQLVGLFAAYHTVSYVRLLAAIEPTRRHEFAGGLEYFFGVLDDAVPR